MRKIPACRAIIRLTAIGCSDKKISEITGATRKTVKKIREKAIETGTCWPLDEFMDDENIYYTLFPPKTYVVKKKKPDLEKAYYMLSEDPVKVRAYEEYRQDCLNSGKESIDYSWFCKLLKKEEQQHRITTDKKLKLGKSAVALWMEHSIKIANTKDDKAYVFMGIKETIENTKKGDE